MSPFWKSAIPTSSFSIEYAYQSSFPMSSLGDVEVISMSIQSMESSKPDIEDPEQSQISSDITSSSERSISSSSD
ncbi:hypothetical protein AQUCO_02200191v1 [Aquilegia coerulea]|uniref:Uncharacterized protein n=1 Tax=Aquilegia coerulea TaxID=218851 RepID=A0A2G5DEB8_AQUCA|nr:hypothetical protein AQUCO_02200191v1 [Aquilegia coerulea]